MANYGVGDKVQTKDKLFDIPMYAPKADGNPNVTSVARHLRPHEVATVVAVDVMGAPKVVTEDGFTGWVLHAGGLVVATQVRKPHNKKLFWVRYEGANGRGRNAKIVTTSLVDAQAKAAARAKPGEVVERVEMV